MKRVANNRKLTSGARQVKAAKRQGDAIPVLQDHDDDIDDGSNDSSEPESTDDFNDDEGSSDDDVGDLPRRLYFYAIEKWKEDSFSNIDKCSKSLDMAKTALLDSNEELKRLLAKARTRPFDDKKVPPGSALVNRDLCDDRFLLSLLCIAQSHIYRRRYDERVIEVLREALTWFPRSIEANYLLGLVLKMYATADRSQYIDLSKTHLRKACAVSALVKKELISVPATSNHQVDSDDEIALANKEAIARELACGDSAEQALILLLCQESAVEEAAKHLESQGFTWRLSTEVLDYRTVSTPTNHSVEASNEGFTYIFDNVLPASMLTTLRHVFRTDSPFWSEHAYDETSNASLTVGYFSYLYPYRNRSASNYIEQVIDYILPLVRSKFEHIGDCQIAEWWVHSRPHTSGHQFHFDSDETNIEAGGKPMHPVASLVIFVNEGEIGGPTLVTDQVLGGSLAEKGWMAPPKENRMVVFDARYLHGVLPGKALLNPDPSKRRLTFMVGFWKSIAARERGLDNPGPGQPFPDISKTSYTWPLEMASQPALGYLKGDRFSEVVERSPIYVSNVWEPIDVDSTKADPASIIRKGLAKKPDYDACFQGF